MPNNTFIHTYHRLRSYIWFRIWFRSSDRFRFRAPAHQGAVRRRSVRRAREVRIRDGIRNFLFTGSFTNFPLRQSFFAAFEFSRQFFGYGAASVLDRRALRSFGRCRTFGPGGRSKTAVRRPAVGVGLACAHWAASPVANFSGVFLRGCVPFAEFAKFLRGLCLFDIPFAEIFLRISSGTVHIFPAPLLSSQHPGEERDSLFHSRGKKEQRDTHLSESLSFFFLSFSQATRASSSACRGGRRESAYQGQTVHHTQLLQHRCLNILT